MQFQRSHSDMPMQPSYQSQPPAVMSSVYMTASDAPPPSPLHPVHLPGYERAPRGISTLPASYTAPAAVVPIIASRIALPTELHAIPLLQLLPHSLASTFSSPAKMLRAREDVDRLDATKPLPPPRVGGSRVQYLAHLKRMHSVGMVAFTSRPRATNGLFAVAKDEHSDRLIIDAQPANRLFIDPDRVSLPNASHLVQLQVRERHQVVCCQIRPLQLLPPPWPACRLAAILLPTTTH